MNKIILILGICLLVMPEIYAQKISSSIKLARLKYSGGGDWYNDPSAEVQLLNFVRKNTNINVDPVYEFVDLNSDNVFSYPILYMTGHGSINFSDGEVKRLRAYLQNGGFLYVDDDYGLNEFIRREMKKVFPDQEFSELPYSFGLFSCHYKFPNGVPKIEEHNNKAAQSYGLFYDGRLCVLYTYESNPSDGWPETEVHNIPNDRRELALKFGSNIIVWALTH
jgi:hypothetical protein